MKRIVFLTGAGMSAESGISTFRDSDGLWEEYNIEDVCTHEAWVRQPEVLLNFYNMLRIKYKDCKPNAGHFLVAGLEQDFDVQIITQNVDDLHQQAGSSHVLHLHGEMMKSRADGPDKGIYYPIDPENPVIRMGDTDPNGIQLRPHIVLFQEDVPNLAQAAEIMATADIVVVIGTSLNVYPAAGLLNYAPKGAPIYLIDPKLVAAHREVSQIQKGASEGMRELVKILGEMK